MCSMQCVLALVALYVGFAHSWDIAIAKGDLLEFYTNVTKTDTVRFNSQNLAALAYDEVHNMMLYVDKQSDNDAICGYDISSMQYKYLTERNGRNIHGLAFDPVTELLFFTDTSERSINFISLKPGTKNNVTGNVLIKMDEGIPTDIAVDSCRGYIYWINTNLTTPTIERARFNGSEKEVVINSSLVSINTTYKLEPQGLAIDQQTQKILWMEPSNNVYYSVYILSANLYGENKTEESVGFNRRSINNFPSAHLSNRLTVSKKTLFMATWLPDYNVWGFPMYSDGNYYGSLHFVSEPLSTMYTIPTGIAANFKVSDQIQGIQDCNTLTSLVRNNSVTNNPFKTATEYDGPFCVNGMKVNGKSLCKCTPGYTGERCDVSVCGNYCIQGNCSFNDEGLPTCRCNAGYSGARCDVNACYGYCLNNGDCSFNKKSEPVCKCKGDYLGDRCEVSVCLNYCIQGNCSSNDEGLPTCRCNAGYSGARCEVNVCYGYCQNNGSCSLNEKSEPVCQCKGDYLGDRCEVSDCLNYCIQGNCSINDEGLPTCRCNAGYSGARCEVNACYGYCQNNGDCSLNEKSEPVCQCKGDYLGDRCEVSDCLNYCIQGNCSINDEGLPTCRCNAGYSGERCEVNACYAYCLNNGDCSLNEEEEPFCRCVGNHEGSRCEAVNNVNFANSPMYSSAGRNPTLADIFSNWPKPISKISVIVESS